MSVPFSIGADVAQVDGGPGPGRIGRAQQFRQVAAQRGVGAGDAHRGSPVHMLPDGITSVASVDRGDRLLRRDPVLLELVGIERDDDGALVAAERRRRGDARQRREQRAHAVQREILHLARAAVGAAEDQLAHGNAAGVETRDERRHGARRHEGAGAVHVADRLRHRLAHVRARMKHQLHQRRALDALAFDVLDAGDVEEVILVVISEIAFHLRRVHAAVGLRHVDRGRAELGENIHRHAPDCQKRRQRNGNDGHHNRDGPPHCAILRAT